MVHISILLLVIALLSGSLQSIWRKDFNKKVNDKGNYTFLFVICLSALLFFIVTSKEFIFNAKVLPYSLLFGSVYLMSTIAGYIAITSGPLFFTSLISSFSLLIPTFYGIIFLQDKIKPLFLPGFLLTIIATLLIIQKGKEEKKVSLKWILCVVINYISGGMCSVSQKMQQLAFDGAYKNEFMIFALIFVCIMLSFFIIKERKEIKQTIIPCLLYGIPCGVSNGISNLFVIMLTSMLATSILFPTLSAGQIIFSYIVSRLYYKETLTRKQFVGSILATLAIVLLNI